MIRQILGASSTPTPRIGGEKLVPILTSKAVNLGMAWCPVPEFGGDLYGKLVMVETMGKIPTLASANLGGITRFKKTKHPSTP